MVFAMQTDVQDVLNGFRSAEQYRSVGTHRATNKKTYMAKQRCMESRASAHNVYRSLKKNKMSLDFKNATTTEQDDKTKPNKDDTANNGEMTLNMFLKGKTDDQKKHDKDTQNKDK